MAKYATIRCVVEDIQKDAATRMSKSIEALKHEFSKIRTGRAHPSLLDQINVSYYGTESSLSQVANIAVEDARTLTITPWEKGMVQAIEKRDGQWFVLTSKGLISEAR